MSTHEIEREVEIEDGEDWVVVTLLVKVEVSGGYAPATWGYDGGTPEEFPEAEITAVTWLDAPYGKQRVPGIWWPFSQKEEESIWGEAVEEAMSEYGSGRRGRWRSSREEL